MSANPEGAARLAWALRVLRGPHVLDSECGVGSLTIALARAGHEVRGADHRPEAVAAARAALLREEAPVQHRAAFLVSEGPLHFPDRAFDSILLEDAGAPNPALEELQRVAKAGGRVAAWFSAPADLDAVDRLAEAFRLEGFEMVDGGIGLELSNARPSAGARQPLVRDVRAAARTLRFAQRGDRAFYGEPAEIAALLRSARADRLRLESVEAQRDEQANALERLLARTAELERHQDAEEQLQAARAHAEQADAELCRLQTLLREQGHHLLESETAAAGLRSQLAQAASDARRRLGAGPAEQNAELGAQARRTAAFGERERQLRRELAGSRASVKLLRGREAALRRELTELKQSRGHRFVRYVWLLKGRRRVLSLKAAVAALLIVAAMIALVLGSAPVAGLMAAAALVAIAVLAVDVAGPLPGIVMRRLRRGRASSP